MTTKGVKRKLTAILSADVEGYSRLMSQDEVGTIRTLTTYREAMSSLIQQYKGRVVDSPGDNLLAEFASVVDAVNCAVEIQRELAERNAELPPARQMEFRIGINLGDIVEEEGRIYGDGVNIAARVESLAEAGGICISGTAYDQVKNKLGLEYDYLGEQTVKNIPEPIRVYKVLSFPGAAAYRVVQAKGAVERKWRKAALAVAAVLVIVIAAAVVWNFLLRPAPRLKEVPSVEKMAFALPDKPSIAVLPFVNISGDPEQEYFSDGLTEEIITALSKFPKLFVIARHSSFSYKGKSVKVQQVGRELGVRYVLEGSVRKTADRVWITAQLIDDLTGHHLWSEKYDRDLEDIFALQEGITKEILMALQVKLTEGDQARLWAKGTRNFEAFMKQTIGREYFLRFTIEDNFRSRQLREEAIALDPEYARAIIGLAWTHMGDLWVGSSKSPGESLEQAEELAQKALALDASLPDVYQLFAWIYLMKKQPEKALAHAEKAVALSPNGAEFQVVLGQCLNALGRPEEAIPFFEKAFRLNPLPPSFYFASLGTAYRMLGRYEEALAEFKKALRVQPNSLYANVYLAAMYSLLGREKEAREAATGVLRLNPKFSVEHFVKTMTFKSQAEKDRYLECLHRAGLK
jgi:adenylate cyclase